MKTPPNRSLVTPQDTPTHFKTQVAKPYATMGDMIRDKEYLEIASDVSEHIVGPVPVNVFLRDLMTPKSGDLVRLPKNLPALKNITNEQKLVDMIMATQACPSLTLSDTHKITVTTPYTNVTRLPDWTVYNAAGEVEMYGERKPRQSDDPFVDPPKGTPRHKHSFVKEGHAAALIVGQLAAYSGVLFEIQSRTHVFLYLICGQRCRLLRWDRAGCIVSEAFHIGDGPGGKLKKNRYLWKFFHRYHLMTAEERGHDPSVSFDVTEEEATRVQELLREAGVSADEYDPQHFRRVKFEAERFGDEVGKEGGMEGGVDDTPVICQFIVTKARVFAENVEGACTRGAVAVRIVPDRANWYTTFLKDTNRYDDAQDEGDKLQTEGRIYKRLHAAGVENIPTLDCSGDAGGDWQRTRTDHFLEYACANVTLFGRQHYYHAVLEIGRPLSEFESTRELTGAVFNALDAHREAYEDARLLHRDISPGNIIMLENGRGLLIDWQFAKEVGGDADRQPRMEWRVGTWQFYSYALHCNKQKLTHDLRDDLESFLWLMLYMIVHYRPNNLDATTTLWYLHGTYDVSLAFEGSAGSTTYNGGQLKLSYLHGNPISFADPDAFENCIPVALRDLLAALRDIFRPIYPMVKGRVTEEEIERGAYAIPPVPKERYGKIKDAVKLKEVSDQWREECLAKNAKLRRPAARVEQIIDYAKVNDHDAVYEAFRDALVQDRANWKDSDNAVDQMPSLRARFKLLQPNAVNATPLDISSSLRRAAGGSSRKRPANADFNQPSSKKRKIDKGTTSSSTTALDASAQANSNPAVLRAQWEQEMSAMITRAEAARRAAAQALETDAASDEEEGEEEEEEEEGEGVEKGEGADEGEGSEGSDEDDEDADSTYDPHV